MTLVSVDKYAHLGNDYHWLWARNQSGPYPRWVRFVLGYLPERGNGAQLLDVGCGDGYPASILAARGYVVHGVDPLSAPLEEARRRVPGATFTTDYPGVAFDYVLALDSIEHMEDITPLVAAVRRCKRKALISTPPPGTDAHAVAAFDRQSLSQLLGLSVSSIHEDGLHQLFEVYP